MIEIEFNSYGKKHKAMFEKTLYVNGNNLYVGVVTWDEEEEYWEPWCDLTVNLPGCVLAKNEAYLDTNNCNPEIIRCLFDKGYVIDTGKVGHSGFCTYPLVRFTEEFLNGMYE